MRPKSLNRIGQLSLVFSVGLTMLAGQPSPFRKLDQRNEIGLSLIFNIKNQDISSHLGSGRGGGPFLNEIRTDCPSTDRLIFTIETADGKQAEYPVTYIDLAGADSPGEWRLTVLFPRKHDYVRFRLFDKTSGQDIWEVRPRPGWNKKELLDWYADFEEVRHKGDKPLPGHTRVPGD